jgi:hypothetical protein
MDPLSPFTSLIRSLWRSRTERSNVPAPAAGMHGGPGVAPPEAQRPRSEEDLREQLRMRLVPLANATPERRCQAFVETVLLSELSESAGTDPRFAEIVGRVVQELTADSRVSARLDELLAELPAASSR